MRTLIAIVVVLTSSLASAMVHTARARAEEGASCRACRGDLGCLPEELKANAAHREDGLAADALALEAKPATSGATGGRDRRDDDLVREAEVACREPHPCDVHCDRHSAWRLARRVAVQVCALIAAKLKHEGALDLAQLHSQSQSESKNKTQKQYLEFGHK